MLTHDQGKPNCLQTCVVIDNVCSYEPCKPEHNRAKHTPQNTILPAEQLHGIKRDGLKCLGEFRSSSLPERSFLASSGLLRSFTERVSAGTDRHA